MNNILKKLEDVTIRISHEKIDDEFLFVARCDELPDIEEYGDTYTEAFDLIIDSIDTTVKILQERLE